MKVALQSQHRVIQKSSRNLQSASHKMHPFKLTRPQSVQVKTYFSSKT